MIYYVVISQCRWPSVDHMTDQSVRAMVVSDTHLLGRIRGHWFDKLRREWQMWRSFQTSVQLLDPNVVIFLGDLFDEGLWASTPDFDAYVNRFKDMFSIDSKTKLIVVVGNHDIGFHYWTDDYLRRRFQLAFNTSDVDLIQLQNGVHFIAINSITLEGDNCHLCASAEHKIKQIATRLRSKNVNPVVLMHFPLYRESEQICSELDSAPEEEKRVRYREKIDCLSRESTSFVINTLRPKLVLSGHSHHSCVVNHTSEGWGPTSEWTVASFSWRNKKNPSFLLVSMSVEEYAIHKCFLPNENHVYLIYSITIFSIFIKISITVLMTFSKQKTH